MKRNDLFNNNHSRQTSSIPYMQPKSGTVYTELSTNQVIGEGKPQEDDKQSYTFKSDTTRNPRSARRKSHFEPFWNQDQDMRNKTERVFEERNNHEEELMKVESRPIRTADGGSKRPYFTERRPKSSVTKGRITTAN